MILTLFSLMLLYKCSSLAVSEVYHIKQSTNASCSEESCLTLSQFVAHAETSNLESNTTLIFLPGHHSLNSQLNINAVRKFSMQSSSIPLLCPTIVCKQNGRVTFSTIRDVYIGYIKFVGCHGHQVTMVKMFVLENTTFLNHSGTVVEFVSSEAKIASTSFLSNLGVQNGPEFFFGYGYGGVIHANNATVTIANSEFTSNHYNVTNGGVLSAYRADIVITGTNFTNNSAVNGGVIYSVKKVNLAITSSNFEENKADRRHGGAIYFKGGKLTLSESNFIKNYAAKSGGALYLHSGDIKIAASKFIDNSADPGVPGMDFLYFNGGAIAIGTITVSGGRVGVNISGTKFTRNKAYRGGAIYVAYSTRAVTLSDSEFFENAAKYGGAVYALSSYSVKMNKSIFENNTANVGIIYAEEQNFIHIHGTIINNNRASQGVVYLLQSASFLSGNMLENNKGSIFAYFSNVTLGENVMIKNCSSSVKSTTLEEGGAITAAQSRVVFEGRSFLISNHVERGGAVHATESKVYVHGRTTIVNNTATDSGGGIYLYQSELKCQRGCILELVNNTSGVKGGGIHAISSTIIAENGQGRTITLRENNARYSGGGVCLEVNSKLYVLMILYSLSTQNTMIFTANSADYGGAVYVADETNSGTCASQSHKIHSTTTECFIQALAFRSSYYHNIIIAKFTENYAHIAGSNLFGGLLDRCTISSLAVKSFTQQYVDSAMYFTSISDSKGLHSISSGPNKICFCNTDQQPDCNYRPPAIQVKKGQTFTVSLVAVDQVNITVPNATIRSSLFSSLGGLGENQLIQSTDNTCTNLTFNVFSPHPSEQLILYADGPCKDAPPSQSRVEINFTSCSCPIGFQPKVAIETRCECECNSDLFPHVIMCDTEEETIVREGVFWVDYIGGYLIHPHCPFDYCKPSDEKVKINLNTQNGANVQCANNRSGILCGTCYSGSSLSLGSSHCIPCPAHWPVMTAILGLVFILGGLLLVATLLFLNLTVAVGTLNGIIFYANVVAANSHTVFPSNVFIAWLNLELGFDTCFFDGMDTYWKTWLQLAFPAYVIFLVVMVIIISERSERFSRLIGKKDPVATLATLVSFSYAKLLQAIIASFSGTVLKYPAINGTYDDQVVWLPDATIKYLSWKHIPLFIVAVLILLAGIAYTAILFSWQWLLSLRLFRWINNSQKLSLFIQTYHAPYTSKHRYWTGLLLVARIILYIVSAANVKGDPKINLAAIGVVVICTLLLKDFVEKGSQIYCKWQIEILEVVCHSNLALLCIITFFTLENTAAKVIFAHLSISFTIALLLAVLLYHLSTEVVFKTKLWRKYKKGPRQLTCDAPATEESGLPTLTYSMVEGPKQSSLLYKRREDGKIKIMPSFNVELKEILCDHCDNYTMS